MSAFAFTALFNAAVAFIFGLWVFIMNPRRDINRLWLAINIAIFGWAFSQFMRETVAAEAAIRWWGMYGIYLSSILIPVFFVHFTLALIGDRKASFRSILLPLYAAAAGLAGAVAFTDYIISGMAPNPFFRHYVIPGPGYPLYLVYFGGAILLGLILLVRGIRSTAGIRRDQLKIILWATVISAAGGSTSFLPVLKIEVFPFGNYFVSLYAIVISYGVFRHRLLDVDVFLRRSLSFLVATITLAIPVFIILVLTQSLYFSQVNPVFTFLILNLLVLASLIFPVFRLKAEQTVTDIFFSRSGEDRRTISRLAQEAVTILDLQRLLKNLVETIATNFKARQVGIMILDEKRGQYRIMESVGYAPDSVNELCLGFNSPWVVCLQEHPTTLYREIQEPLEGWAERGCRPADLLNGFRATLVIPLVVKNRLVGLTLLGEKESGRPYTQDDLDLLRTLANQAAIAVENARLYDDLKKSRQYMRRADRLASLGALAAGLAHEIRNPLVSIKTFIQLLPQRMDDPDFRTTFLSIANDEVERIRRLVEELLNFARPSEPNLQPCNPNEIVEKTLLLVENDLKGKLIVLTRSLEKDLPEALIDKEQVKQVVLNIVLNAIQAVGGGGQIGVATRSLGAAGSPEAVQIEVSDNGSGIQEDDLEQIFTPFFTTKSLGSGLGLAISHQIIKEHHGTIMVESTPGKGSTFFITLPLDPRKHERRRSGSE